MNWTNLNWPAVIGTRRRHVQYGIELAPNGIDIRPVQILGLLGGLQRTEQRIVIQCPI